METSKTVQGEWFMKFAEDNLVNCEADEQRPLYFMVGEKVFTEYKKFYHREKKAGQSPSSMKDVQACMQLGKALYGWQVYGSIEHQYRGTLQKRLYVRGWRFKNQPLALFTSKTIVDLDQADFQEWCIPYPKVMMRYIYDMMISCTSLHHSPYSIIDPTHDCLAIDTDNMAPYMYV